MDRGHCFRTIFAKSRTRKSFKKLSIERFAGGSDSKFFTGDGDRNGKFDADGGDDGMHAGRDIDADVRGSKGRRN
jgi:hypothetical protein